MAAAFLFALVAVFTVSLGARDQLLVAHMSQRMGKRAGLLAVAAAASCLSAFLMAFAGLALALVLPEPAADMLVAIALLIAAVELAWPVRMKLPKEPTGSLFATLIVLLARQVGDAARFLVFAFAAGGSAWLAGLGGALGGIAAMAVGILLAEELRAWPLRTIRLVLAAAILAAAVVAGLSARGLIG